MDKLTMIDTLRERADISYEEAKEVLEQANDDLLEAIVILEQQGKIKTEVHQDVPGSDETLHAETADDFSDTADRNCGNRSEKGVSFGKTVRSAFGFILHTSFHVRRRDKELFTMPTWLMAILLPTFWGVMIPVMLIALFFECRYSFSGQGNVEAANEFFSKAGSFAEGVESGLQKEA